MNLLLLSERKLHIKRRHVSYDTILGLENEFETCILENGEYYKNKQLPVLCFSKTVWIYNIIKRKFKLGKVAKKDKRLISKARRQNEDTMLFFVAMGLDGIMNQMATLSEVNKRLIIYIFDCWESQWEQYDAVLKILNPYAICFAYYKAQEHFIKKGYKNCWFVPQSMDVRYFQDYGMKKERLFMQMGRRVEQLHELVCKYLEENKIENSQENYAFEREKGTIIFKDTEILAKEINRTLFFIAAPQCIHNYKLTGNISEVTARFYEAMACQSLIIGVKPKDTFDMLFPYENAMIEVDKDNFSTKITQLLNDNEKYKSIVKRNYQYVMTQHRWKNRYNQIIKLLESEMNTK